MAQQEWNKQEYRNSTAQGASPQQNQWVEKTLRSPEHGRVSDRILLLTFRGRKSGKSYSTPVSYMQRGNTVVCFTDSPWWRNLEGGVSVQLVLRGHEMNAHAVPTTDPEQVAGGLRTLCRKDAEDAKYFGVTVGADGEPNEAQLMRAAQANTMIQMELQA